jgi:D-alanine-D-alanine ligase
MSKLTSSLGKVAVLMGGSSAERDISLMSGTGVLQALRGLGVDAHAFDPAHQDILHLQKEHFERAFIALHGRGGEDGCIQGCLETMGIPYTGSGVMASAIGMDKIMTKLIWQAHGLSTPPWLRLSGQDRFDQPVPRMIETLGLPLFVKPAKEGSSIGVSKVVRLSDLPQALTQASQCDADILCESFIEGDEVTCPVLGEGDTARALPVVRIVPPVEGYDYQNKYYTDAVRYHCPSGLSTTEEAEIQALTLQAYRAIGCRGWARADIIIRAQDRKPFLLEINTAPGMTDHSLVPMSARSAGIAYPELCLQLLAAARLDSHQPTLAGTRLGEE